MTLEEMWEILKDPRKRQALLSQSNREDYIPLLARLLGSQGQSPQMPPAPMYNPMNNYVNPQRYPNPNPGVQRPAAGGVRG